MVKLKYKMWLFGILVGMDCMLAGMLWMGKPGNSTGRPVEVNGSSSQTEVSEEGIAERPEGDSGEDKAEGKIVALTFDDGPHKLYTEKLLDGLKERGVKATFFLIGESIDGNEELVKRMSDDGHLIGNHTYHHVQLTKETKDKALEEIALTNQKIFEITGKEPVYIRPPFGSWNEELAEEINMTPVLWNVDPTDWKNQNCQSVTVHILKNVSDSDIILLHDIFSTSVDAALQVVDKLLEKGYSFVTVEDLLID